MPSLQVNIHDQIALKGLAYYLEPTRSLVNYLGLHYYGRELPIILTLSLVPAFASDHSVYQ